MSKLTHLADTLISPNIYVYFQGDYEDVPTKSLVLNAKNNISAELVARKSTLSDKIKISECSKKGCKKKKVPSKLRKKLDKCSFQGHLNNDPESRVSLNECSSNGEKDISVVSEKVDDCHGQRNMASLLASADVFF